MVLFVANTAIGTGMPIWHLWAFTYFWGMYLLRAPALARKVHPSFLEWEGPSMDSSPCIYLTFDDGPHPVATPFALDLLESYQAKATFFCIGKNVVEHPDIYEQILEKGHKAGNHTHRHLNGWKTRTETYLEDVEHAARYIDSGLFRPPYGRIRKKQALGLKEKGYRIVMWSLISGDFDSSISPERCLENVVFHLRPFDILVMHDSQKAWDRMSYALPRILEHCKKSGWSLKAL